MPAWLTLIYVSGVALIGLLLLVSIARAWFWPASYGPHGAGKFAERFAQASGRDVDQSRIARLALAICVRRDLIFGFHVYWARYAAEGNPKFQELSYKDLRNRRLSESTLRGWIYDRKGRPLAYYRKNNVARSIANIRWMPRSRTSLAAIAANPGLERALFGAESGVVPEVWQIIKGQTVEQKAQQGLHADHRSGSATGRGRSIEGQSRRGCHVQSANRRRAGHVQQSVLQPETGR
jgi:hypothetical protein